MEIASLQHYNFEWRGIYFLREKNGQRLVLRLLKRSEAAEEFYKTAKYLDWLYEHGYPAPRIRRTRADQLVGKQEHWASLLLSFIDGEVITPRPIDLQLLSARVGQLHTLPHDSAPIARLSRCHPETISIRTIQQLTAGSQFAPQAYIPLFKRLHDSMISITEIKLLPLGVTHGDCWYMNAIKTDTGEVQLIDWDNVGIGLPILDLGYLLLSSHFRLDHPFSIPPDKEKIEAIMKGYQAYYRFSHQELDCLLDAVHFPLAYHLGNYYENNAPLVESDTFLAKTQQRFDHAEAISQIARAYIT